MKKTLLLLATISLFIGVAAAGQWETTLILGTGAFAPRSLACGGRAPVNCVVSLGRYGAVWESRDGGRRWNPVDGVTASSLHVAADGRVFGFNTDHFLKRETPESPWQKEQLETDGCDACLVATDPSRPEVIYRNLQTPCTPWCAGGLFKSDDGGQTWTSIGFRGRRFADLAVQPNQPTNVWLSSSEMSYGDPYEASLYVSHDGGLTWVNLFPGMTVDIRYISFANDGSVFAIYKWWNRESLIYMTPTDYSWTVRELLLGPTVSMMNDFAIDPEYPRRMYAAAAGLGVVRSRDYGKTWEPYSEGISSPRAYQLQFEPTTRALVVSSMNADLTSSLLYYRDVSNDLIADFTISKNTISVGEEIMLTNRSKGEVTHVEWDFGDGTQSDARETVTHSFSAPGVYHVRLAVQSLEDSDKTELQIEVLSGKTRPHSVRR